MEAKTLPIYNVEGKEVDSVKLDAKVFDGVVNTAAMHSAVNSFRANQRRGLACVKSRGEVSGGGRKPWKQKGTGRARVGSIRSPLWRHGGVTFGPVPHDFGFDIPQKIRELALKSSLNAKLNENSIIVLDALKLDNGKTKDAAKIFSNLKAADTKRKNSTLLLIHAFDDKLKLALRNLSFLNVNLAAQTNTYEIFSHKRIVITKDGLQDLTHRLKK